MELSWSTFGLEIVNFLVLVWILKRFLYQPVLDVIARRRAGIEKILADAQTLSAEAETLHEKYEGRLAHWEQERRQAREALAQELDGVRAGKMAELHNELENVQQKARVSETRRQVDAARKTERSALAQAAKFATRLLENGAGPETEARLVDMVIAGLCELPAERIAEIRGAQGRTPSAIVVISAFALPDEPRRRLEQVLPALGEPGVPIRFELDGDLMAGLRIIAGAWVLGANLRDELAGFADLAHDG